MKRRTSLSTLFIFFNFQPLMIREKKTWVDFKKLNMLVFIVCACSFSCMLYSRFEKQCLPGMHMWVDNSIIPIPITSVLFTIRYGVGTNTVWFAKPPPMGSSSLAICGQQYGVYNVRRPRGPYMFFAYHSGFTLCRCQVAVCPTLSGCIMIRLVWPDYRVSMGKYCRRPNIQAQ